MIDKLKEVVMSWLGIPNQLINHKEKTIVIPENYTVIVSGDFKLKTTGHVIIESGKTIGEDGLVKGIWLNPEYDNNGQLICRDPEIIEGECNDDKHRCIK